MPQEFIFCFLEILLVGFAQGCTDTMNTLVSLLRGSVCVGREGGHAYMHACVCVCARVCGVCVHACVVCVCVRACVRACVCV